MRERRVRRVTWMVRRDGEGWLPVVLIGSAPITDGPPIMDKSLAKRIARQRAAQLRGAGA